VPVVLGSDVLFDRQLLTGRTVGIVCNPASIDGQFRHVVERAEASGVIVGAIFGPQHGFRSDLQENMIESPHGRDARRQVPVYSLYSETREPSAEMLAGLDALVIDLQDVGTRIYTYIYTMANCMAAARKQGLPVIVCDRPNPAGGDAVEGPMLARGFESFVGLFPIPMRHGMTIGELARLFNDRFGIDAKLEVVKMQNWSRGQYGDETGLPWVLPSPNIPTVETTVIYPGTVLLEGTNISEGRGTNRPFELVGAPWADPERVSSELNALELPGVKFRPALFEPTYHKHAGVACGGCQIHVTDRPSFRAVEAGVAVIAAFRSAGPQQFAWREPPYEYEYEKPPIDVLYGSAALREGLERGETAASIAASWAPELAPFVEVRERYLLY
jgi:uncharacterized protein YbbC (DUF1343 family)